jgi:hypothetical protein
MATASVHADRAASKVVPQIRLFVPNSLFNRSSRCATFTVSPYTV